MKNRRRRLLQSNNEDSAQTGVVPSYVINDINQSCNECVSGQSGLVKYQGITSFAGGVILRTNSFTSVDATGLTSQTGALDLRGNQVTSANFKDLVTGGNIDLLGNPLATVDFSSLVTLSSNHIYLAGAFGTGTATLTSASFPELTTINFALVLSRRYNLASVSLPKLVTLSHEIELDYCKALTALSLPLLTTLNFTAAGPNLILGGDMTDIGQSRPPALSSLSMPSLTAVNGGYISATWCTNLTTFDISSWTTISNGFGLNMNRCNLSQAAMDAILVKLVDILGGVTSGTVDLRFQNGGQIPSASGQAAAATLVAAGIRNSQGGTTLYA